MSDTIKTENLPRKCGWLKWVLTLSLAVNLLLAGLIGGAIWVRHHSSPIERIAAKFLKLLPENKRDTISTIFVKYDKNTVPQWKKLLLLQAEILRLLKQDRYDPIQLKKMLDDLQAHQMEMQSVRHQFVIDLAQSLTAKERRQFIQLWNGYIKRIRRFLPRSARKKIESGGL